jgi:hypothetical protein
LSCCDRMAMRLGGVGSTGTSTHTCLTYSSAARRPNQGPVTITVKGGMTATVLALARSIAAQTSRLLDRTVDERRFM